MTMDDDCDDCDSICCVGGNGGVRDDAVVDINGICIEIADDARDDKGGGGSGGGGDSGSDCMPSCTTFNGVCNKCSECEFVVGIAVP